MTKPELFAALFVAGLFVGMLVCLEIGLILGRRSTSDEGGKEGLRVIEGAIFALLGLLIAFTFPGRLRVLRTVGTKSLKKPTTSARRTCGSTCFRPITSLRFASCFDAM